MPPTDTLIQLAEAVRVTLRRADDLGLVRVAIHLDAALIVLASAEGTGAIELEPFDLDA